MAQLHFLQHRVRPGRIERPVIPLLLLHRLLNIQQRPLHVRQMLQLAHLVRQPRHIPAERPQLIRRIARRPLAMLEMLTDAHLTQGRQIHLIQHIRLILGALVLQLLHRLRHKALGDPFQFLIHHRRQPLALDHPPLGLQRRRRLPLFPG